jgi:hypothetical protein
LVNPREQVDGNTTGKSRDGIDRGWAEYVLREAERARTRAREALERFKRETRREAARRSGGEGFGPLPAPTVQLNGSELRVLSAALEVARAQDRIRELAPQVLVAEELLADELGKRRAALERIAGVAL